MSLQPVGRQKWAEDEESFYTQCRANYLAVFSSSLTNITSKQQLCRVLQQAGRNPSKETLNKHWTQRTSKLNFDDFCDILKHEKPTEQNELMRAFKKMDMNGDGFICHSELQRVLTSRGERMSMEEVNAVFSLTDANKDGKLDYAEFCRMLLSTAQCCQTTALERLEADAQLRRQNFGNQSDSPPKAPGSMDQSDSPPKASRSTDQSDAPLKASGSTDQSDAPLKASGSTDQSDSPPKGLGSTAAATTLPQPPDPARTDPARTEPARTEPDATAKKDSRSSSRSSSARSRRSSLSSSITMTTSSTKPSRVPEPTALQGWHHSNMKGTFFLEDDGSISSLQYRLHLPQSASIHLTIQPLNLSQRPDKPSVWMNVDTALFVVSSAENKEESSFVCFTESRDKERSVWKGELAAGSYQLLPFTSGCRLRRGNRKSAASKPAQLVYRTDTGELDLTREFMEALSDIFEVIDLDGNGLLSLEEYNLFELRTSGERCDEEAWAVCKENFDTRRNQLTKQGFMELNLMEATERDGDPADLWITLEAMGYNCSLEMVEACPFLVEVHSEGVQVSLQAVSLDSRLLSQALQRSISSRAEARTLRGHDHVLIYTYRGEHRVSSLVANKTNQKVTVHVNNDQSQNCMSSRGMSVFAVEVPGRTKMVIQHVLPISDRQEWTYNCVESILPCQ